MKPSRKLSRRSFFSQVAGGVIAGGGALAAMTGKARAQVTDSDPRDVPGAGTGTGITDTDTGAIRDPIGRGRGSRPPPRSGCSDNDAGDPTGNGRRCRQYPNDASDDGADAPPRRTGLTDSDRGSPNADMEGFGRGNATTRPPSGYTDSDPTDPSGNGRRYEGGPAYTGNTDADPGDRAGYGRGGSRRCTDADTGTYADPAGQGRFCPTP